MEETIKVKAFNFGDMVSTKITGLPGIGEIIAIMDASLYLQLNRINTSKWDGLFEDWRKKPIYYIYFTEDRKVSSYQEYKKDFLEKFPKATEDQIQDYYDRCIPETNLISYVHDDLELWEGE